MQSLRQKLKKNVLSCKASFIGRGHETPKTKKTNEQNLALFVSTPSIMVFTPNMHVSF